MSKHLNLNLKNKIGNLFFILGIILIVIIWIISSKQIDNEMVIPSFEGTIKRVWELLTDISKLLLILDTLLKLIVIIALCSIVCFILAIISYKYEWFSNLINPFITIIRTAPIISLIIILLLCAGLEKTPIYICSFVVMPVIYEQILNSFKSIDKDIIEETKMISNINFKIFIYVFFPITFKYFITSLLTVLGLGFKVLVMAEVFGSTSSTLGGLLQTYRSVGDMQSIFALTIILILIVLIFEGLIKIVYKKTKEPTAICSKNWHNHTVGI